MMAARKKPLSRIVLVFFVLYFVINTRSVANSADTFIGFYKAPPSEITIGYEANVLLRFSNTPGLKSFKFYYYPDNDSPGFGSGAQKRVDLKVEGQEIWETYIQIPSTAKPAKWTGKAEYELNDGTLKFFAMPAITSVAKPVDGSQSSEDKSKDSQLIDQIKTKSLRYIEEEISGHQKQIDIIDLEINSLTQFAITGVSGLTTEPLKLFEFKVNSYTKNTPNCNDEEIRYSKDITNWINSANLNTSNNPSKELLSQINFLRERSNIALSLCKNRESKIVKLNEVLKLKLKLLEDAKVRAKLEVEESVKQNSATPPTTTQTNEFPKIINEKVPNAGKQISIKCNKGKTNKKVSGTNPKCPKGYKKVS
jgi:hypothetical protein